jgi:hypothetical protein
VRTLFDEGPIRRADVARRTTLTPVTTVEIAEHGANAIILGAAALLLSHELGLTLRRGGLAAGRP